MPIAYIYIRFSTPRQEHSSSKYRQLEDCRAFAERKGWDVIDVVEDLGRSAWHGDHLKSGNLGKFAARIFDGDVAPGVIIVENLDRLSRQKPRVTQRWMEDICDRGFKIASVKGDKVYDATSLEENIMDILDVLYQGKAANDYVETLSRRVKSSYKSRLEKARSEGTPISTAGPAWLEPISEPPWWRPRPDHKRIITDIFNMAIDGKPPWSIAIALNERGDKSFTGKAWERTAIVKIIRNRAIEGDYVVGEGKTQKPTGEVLVGYYGEPLLPLTVINEARAMLDRRSRKGSGRNSGAVNNLFPRSIRCGTCGGRMMQMGYKSSYLICYEATRRNGCDQNVTFKYRPFEKAALDRILPLALDDRFFRQADKANGLGDEIAVAKKAISDTEAEAEHAYDLHLRLRSATAERRLMEAEAKLQQLRETLIELEGRLATAQGAASAQAHLQRVHEFRSALHDPDEEIRLPARLRVAEAIRNIEARVVCRIENGEKRFELTLLDDGVHAWAAAFVFDNEGSLIHSVDVMELIEAEAAKIAAKGITVTTPVEPVTDGRQRAMRDYLHRRARAGDDEMQELRTGVADLITGKGR